MKKSVCLAWAFMVLPLLIMAQPRGQVMDNLSIDSRVIGQEVDYAVYLPPDYASSQRSYPVLYLLHGSGGDHTSWVQAGEVAFIADKAILEGKATPLIIVMPSSKGGKSGFFNGYKGEWPYEDFFFQEFIPFIEDQYRIRKSKRYRAISGLSMGGRSSFAYGIHHPDIFSSVCPLSPGSGPIDPEDARDFYGPRGLSEAGDEEMQEYDRTHSILRLLDQIPVDQKDAVRWYLDCGDDDGLSMKNCLMHISMIENEIPHEFRMRDGRHGWQYWRESLPEVLEFISARFR